MVKRRIPVGHSSRENLPESEKPTFPEGGSGRQRRRAYSLGRLGGRRKQTDSRNEKPTKRLSGPVGGGSGGTWFGGMALLVVVTAFLLGARGIGQTDNVYYYSSSTIIYETSTYQQDTHSWQTQRQETNRMQTNFPNLNRFKQESSNNDVATVLRRNQLLLEQQEQDYIDAFVGKTLRSIEDALDESFE
jgi:hypothetical protein